MKLSNLTLAVATLLSAGASSGAFAIDLYVDTHTKQIYAEPGLGRERMGSFERVEDAPQKAPDAAEVAHLREDLEYKSVEIKALQEHMTEAEKGKIRLDEKGVQFESSDKDFKFKLGGRIHADANFTSGDDYVDADGAHVEANDGTEVRRARMEFQGTFFKDWGFRTVADFADDKVALKDAYIQYLGSKFVTITAGQQKQNFSRELQESSNDMMFTERSLMNILNAPTVDRAIGLNFEHFDKDFVAKLGVFGDSITPPGTSGSVNTDGTTKTGHEALDEGWGVSSRVTYAPINEKTQLIHLGIAGNYRAPDDNGEVAKSKSLKYAYETNNMSDLDLIDASVKDVNDIKMLGLEAAGLYGPYSVGAEYTKTWIGRENGANDLRLEGWYAEAAWSITGESRKYKDGNFRYLKPAKNFSLKNGGWGAWELATRYSGADLNDRDFTGGEIHNVTVALNWYLNSNFRFMADYTRVLDVTDSPLTTPTGDAPDNLGTITLRGQVAF